MPEFVRQLFLVLITAEQKPVGAGKRQDGILVPKVEIPKGAKERCMVPGHGPIVASLSTADFGAEHGSGMVGGLAVLLPRKINPSWRIKAYEIVLVRDHHRGTVFIQPGLPVVGTGNGPLEILERFA